MVCELATIVYVNFKSRCKSSARVEGRIELLCISSGSYKYFLWHRIFLYNIKLFAFLTCVVRIDVFSSIVKFSSGELAK